MDADATPATPTPEGLAAALRLIDSYGFADYEYGSNAAEIHAVFAVARAAVGLESARAVLNSCATDWEAADAGFDVELGEEAYNAAVARLVALATGAQAGEGAGGC